MACPSSPAPTPVPPTPVDTESSYNEYLDKGIIENGQLDEGSGLIASRKNPGYFWALNDSGDPNRLFYFDSNGKGKKEFYLTNANNRDWEDMSITTEADGSSTIYVADFGDNNVVYQSYNIYWFTEPTVSNSGPDINAISQVKKLTFVLPDGMRDMECLLVDQVSKDIFIVSKREDLKRLYKISAANVKDGAVLTAEFINELSFSNPFSSNTSVKELFYVTAGDVSFDNKEIIIRNYGYIYYWKRKDGESIPDALARQAKTVPCRSKYSSADGLGEPQGEGLAFAADAQGYYTISESAALPGGIHFYFFKRK
ncbi:MAG: hypothetical protein ACKOWQ_08885 [Aquirufa sp.]